jgi:hypothetical protein
MRGRPDEEVLRELMDEMNGMDKERLGKKRSGPSITIAIGVPKGEEKEMEEKECEGCGGAGCPECEKMDKGMGSETGMEMPGMDEENDMSFDSGEQSLIDEAKSLGIDDPEEIDMRLLKKLVDRKKAQG